MADTSTSSATFEDTSLQYEAALTGALAQFKQLIATPDSRSWKRLQASTSTSDGQQGPPAAAANGKGKSKEKLNGFAGIELANVMLHRRTGKGADIVRATAEVPVAELVDLQNVKAVLQTPEVRSNWDKLVDNAHFVELRENQCRITKTDYRLGWPASPRDTVTISKTYSDSTTLIDISTSIPRSADEPAFLRPAPPYVRSHVHLQAFCIQLPPPDAHAAGPSKLSSTPPASSLDGAAGPKAKITVFFQWSLRGALFSTHHQQVAHLLVGLIDFVRFRGDHIPLVSSYGRYLELGQAAFDRSLETLNVEYSILADDEVEAKIDHAVKGPEELARQKERRRLERALEFSLSSLHGWDVQVKVEAHGEGAEVGHTTHAESLGTDVNGEGRLILRLAHQKISKASNFVKVTVGIQRLAGGKRLKVNGVAIPINSVEARDPSLFAVFDDTASFVNTLDTASTSERPQSAPPPPLAVSQSTHTQNQTMSLLKRNYIYFTSLLQEPEAKWRHISDTRGVTVTQLNSIDPTLTIYRAEATFVGVGVWDVFATIATPGARMQWDKTIDELTLLEDLNELSALCYSKTKGAWPVVPRDNVSVRTAYKSPSSVHVFSFSTDDRKLFPSIPPVSYPTIRTQTDLYGWAIEALSPTTTQITLLDQSDPKGWSNKSWTPAQMVAAVAGVGEFSIKFGPPPVITRLLGAKMTLSRYEYERYSLKTEYRAAPTLPSTVTLPGEDQEASLLPASSAHLEMPSTIECEIRCDCSTWAQSIDVVIDPPPTKVSCLSRHRLSSGGGLWITVEHEAVLVGTERILLVVRRGPAGRERGSVYVNGGKIKVDTEVLSEDEVKLLSKRKRMKASPIPLDQYPALGPRLWRNSPNPSGPRTSPLPTPNLPQLEDPIKEHVEAAAKDKEKEKSPLSQSVIPTIEPEEPPPPPDKPPLTPPGQALEALSWLQQFHAEQGPELNDPVPGWATASDRGGVVVRKKLVPGLSGQYPVYRGDKILQGLSAEDVATLVSSVSSRGSWDDRVDSSHALSSYGYGCTTSAMTTKPAFPFRGRVFYLSAVSAQTRVPSASATSSTSTVHFIASASCQPDETFDSAKVNPLGLAPGQIRLEGWILETLDPYASSILAIPSTRCTYLSCVEHSGSMSFALNSVLNANPVRIITAVEALAKSKCPLPRLLSPDTSMHIEGPLSDDGTPDCVWKLDNLAPARLLLVSDFLPSEDMYQARLRLAPSAAPKEPHDKDTALKRTNGFTPATKALPPGAIFKGELPKSASANFLSSSPPKATLHGAAVGELVRKSSTSSLREKRSSSPGPAQDGVAVAELLIDLKQYPHGYSVTCARAFLPADPTAEKSSLEGVNESEPSIPLKATAHDAPLPATLAASLDFRKRTNHLLRVILPVSPALLASPRPDSPEWLRSLSKQGAVFDVRVTPLPRELDPKSAERGPRVVFNGVVLEIASQRASRGVLTQLEDDEWGSSKVKISRGPRRRKKTDADDPDATALPVPLRLPLAVATSLLAVKVPDAPVEEEEFPDPKSPEGMSPTEEKTEAQALDPSKQGATGADAALEPAVKSPLMGLFGTSNPLSRLGTRVGTRVQLLPPMTDSRSAPTNRTTFTLSFVIAVAVISFLFGSLLRSLVTPADFIIYPSGQRSAGKVEHALMQAMDPERRWREARRLFEMRSFFFSRWDLIIAVVRRS